MTSIHGITAIDRYNHPGPRLRPRMKTTLPAGDHRKLRQHLDLCKELPQPAMTLLAHVLRNKIRTTEPVSNLHARDLVTGGCHVTYSVNGGAHQAGLLVHRAGSGSGSSVIPVASLLGATLIGMRVGQQAPLLCEDGTITSVSVLGVTPQN
ncbi:hypothetical protein [Pukyongiella litopenaei]|uniref:Transcription elongation factor GreA/GreB C-terminal domain-containing protein n=1 Tax=Pukyongiella litopenaei TaxID=2605946 RepID=A0A2S0MNP0_9RHOB|nr:hypothetical protein [Pukyongiella litopenaei]AVO37512.2 hypothetical protein C6Y53_07185 [Pukyongiella litopenaei]